MVHHSADKTYALLNTPANRKLISQLENEGEKLLIFPPVRAAAMALDEDALATVGRASEFDWIIFPDVLAVDFFLDLWRELEINPFDLDLTRICALGEAVSDRLRFAQVHADVIPTKLDDEAVFSAIAEYEGGDFERLRFLLLKESSTSVSLVKKLEKENSTVEQVSVYRTFLDDDPQILRLRTLLRGGAVDEFVFSSAEDLIALKKHFPGESLVELLAEIKISALNEQVFQYLLENGLRPLFYHRK